MLTQRIDERLSVFGKSASLKRHQLKGLCCLSHPTPLSNPHLSHGVTSFSIRKAVTTLSRPQSVMQEMGTRLRRELRAEGLNARIIGCAALFIT